MGNNEKCWKNHCNVNEPTTTPSTCRENDASDWQDGENKMSPLLKCWDSKFEILSHEPLSHEFLQTCTQEGGAICSSEQTTESTFCFFYCWM